LALLSEYYHAKQRIHVVTRRAASIRGYCEGELVAFDKHWNLILYNVYEEFTIPACNLQTEEGLY
jgi:small nuclear ribonucleoprotein (snRNP)-like protein